MLIISIKKLSKCLIKATIGIIYHFEKGHVTQGRRGLKKMCQKSVTYYLNGPLGKYQIRIIWHAISNTKIRKSHKLKICIG